MEKIIIISALALLSLTCIASDKTSCLTTTEQKELGQILLKYDQVVKERPDCEEVWGRYACLTIDDESMRDNLLNKLKKCSLEQTSDNGTSDI